MASNRGGRIAPDGRPPQAKGVGRNAKRHDLERPATPGLHGSDLQQGDVQALEQGQRIAPASTQGQAAPPPPPQGGGGQQAPVRQGAPIDVPDPIDFLAQKNGPGFERPQARRQLDQSRALTWLPILRQLAAGPGASPALVSAFIDQARKMHMAASQPATWVDMRATDDGIQAMLDVGVSQWSHLPEEDVQEGQAPVQEEAQEMRDQAEQERQDRSE